jgi:hypothetical protein
MQLPRKKIYQITILKPITVMIGILMIVSKHINDRRFGGTNPINTIKQK